MSTNYNNQTFSIFKMNTKGILTLTSTKNGIENYNFHPKTHLGLTCTVENLKSQKDFNVPHHQVSLSLSPCVFASPFFFFLGT